ncbi:carbohydrate esterase family 4 protein [Astrocystis sublimbata]|nr:carbohydrate esterase family 4 protein [Astrocystis sublimbata]
MMSATSTPHWPNGARAAIALTLDNMGEAADLDRGLWPASEPIGTHYSVTEALPCILALLAKHDIHVTYFVEAWNLSVYPDTIDALAHGGHELAWHAWRHEAWGKLEEAAEKANFDRSFGREGLEGYLKSKGVSHGEGDGMGRVERYSGFRPPGGLIHGERTLQLCRHYGLDYISPAAESAAMVKTGSDEDFIAVLPFKWTTVDALYYMDTFGKLRAMKGFPGEDPQTPTELAKAYIAQIDEAIGNGGFLSLLFHPFLTNLPERMAAMETVVQYLAKKRDEGAIWLARCRDIAAHMHEHPDIVGDDPKWDATSWR